MAARPTVFLFTALAAFLAASRASPGAEGCCDSPFNLGFSASRISSPAPYEGIVELAPGSCSAGGGAIHAEIPNCRPFTGTAHVFAGISSNLQDPPEPTGVQGWSLSIALDGDIDFGPHGVTTSGTSVDHFFSGGFILASVVDPGKNGGQRGAISAVVLSIPETRTLPAAGTESVLDLELVPGRPVREELVAGELRYLDGLRVSGEPVDNYLTVDDGPVRPCNFDTARVSVSFLRQSSPIALFLRGNSNGDLKLDLADAVWLIVELFGQGPSTPCPEASDANGDDGIDLSDAVFLINYLFLGGRPPPAPFPECDEASVCRLAAFGCFVDQPGCQ